jgi:hypothetical protein
VIRRFLNSLSCVEESMAGHVVINGILLKVREEKYKGKPGGAQAEARSQQSVFLLLKSTITYGKGRTRRFPSNNEWGGAWAFPGQVRVVPEPKHG